MTTSSEVFGGAAITALGLAASRTVESGRPDRLISDPLAEMFVKAAALDLPMRLRWPHPGETVTDTERLHLHGSRYIGVRTRFYDDRLLDASRDDVRQGILIGAGLDTRAFRLALPRDFHLIELDQPTLLEWKQSVIQAQGAVPLCRRSWAGIDLRQDWPAALARHGFDPERPAVFIAEGLLPYLDVNEQHLLLERITELAAAGSALALDRIVGDPQAGSRAQELGRRSGLDMAALLASGDGGPTSALLQDRGWEVVEQPVSAVAATYGRDLADPFGAASPEPPWLDTAFIAGQRR